MFFLHNFKNKYLIISLLLSILISTVGSTKVISQSIGDTIYNEVRIGIRSTASPIENFCREFGKSLQGRGWQVEYSPVIHQYVNRYEGLQNKTIDIECGSNSRESQNLLDAQGRTFGMTIAFVAPDFYTTGTRLLLKKEKAENLKRLDRSKLREELKQLGILVVENTTTYNKFKENTESYQNVIPVTPTNYLNARDRALDALENQKIETENGRKVVDAFASDAVMIQSLLQEGVRQEGKIEDRPFFQKERNRYDRSGFVAFPSKNYPSSLKGNYLPLSSEHYAIAIRKEDSQKYFDIIRDALSELNNPGSELAKARTEIDKFEKGDIEEPYTRDTTKTDKSGTSKTHSKKEWWQEPTAIAALIAAVSSIIVALLNPQLVTAFLSPIMGFISTIIGRKSSISKPRQLRLHGLVLDNETNTAIQGAEISLNAPGLQLTNTDALGNFIFPVESLENAIRVYVNANGYRRYDRYVIFPANTETYNIEIRLSRLRG